MSEAVVWTIVFFGGDLLIVLVLLFLAVRKDMQKTRAER